MGWNEDLRFNNQDTFALLVWVFFFFPGDGWLFFVFVFIFLNIFEVFHFIKVGNKKLSTHLSTTNSLRWAFALSKTGSWRDGGDGGGSGATVERQTGRVHKGPHRPKRKLKPPFLLL